MSAIDTTTINPVVPVTGTTGTAAITTVNGTDVPSYTAASTVSSLGALKEIAPDLYKGMMSGIAQNVMSQMQDHQKKLKELMREQQRSAEGS